MDTRIKPQDIVEDGFCKKHNRFIFACDECLEGFREAENREWMKKQTMIRENCRKNKTVEQNWLALLAE